MHRCVVGVAALFMLSAAVPLHAQWVNAPGTGWINVQLAHQSTDTGYDRNGNVVSLDQLDPEARSIITTARVTGAAGLAHGLDVWMALPVHRNEFHGSGSDFLKMGLGDFRAFLRIGPSLVGVEAPFLAAAVRGGVKLSTGAFENDAGTIALSQGQRDWELLLELGKSLHPWQIYAAGWVGRRWREKNEEIGRNPGNEWISHVSVGGTVERFRWKATVDGTFGQRSVDTNTGFVFAPRELVQLIPTIGWTVGPGVVQVGARIPVHGQSTRSDRLPAGPTATLGYFFSWDEPLWE